jgi:hypothetical protein
MWMRFRRLLLTAFVLVTALSPLGCGVESGIPERYKNSPPPEIPGEKEMNRQMQGARR